MTTKRAAIYARQSLDRTGEGLAVTRQVEDCRKLAADRGWQVAGEYIDNDTSASGRKPRPEYRRLLADMRSGHVTAVAAWAADRLTRRPIEIEELIEIIEAGKIALATVSGEVDLSTPYGRAVARIFGAIARQEVEQKGARQARANLQRAQAGTSRLTRRPFGYDITGTSVQRREAAELKRAAKAIIGGASLAACVRDLDRRGSTTSTGAPWSLPTLRRVLINPRYAAHAVYRGQIVGRGQWPAILSDDLHYAVVAKLSDPRRRVQTSTATKYLLSGLAVCGRCGERMYASSTGPKGRYWLVYKCQTPHLTRKLEHVDPVVEAVVIARLARPDAAGLLGAEAPDLGALRTEALDLRTRLDALADAYADGLTTAAGYRSAAARVKERLAGVERDRLAGAATNPLGGLIGVDDVRAAWDGLTLTAKRGVIGALMRVTILPAGKGVRFAADQISIEWRR